VAVGADRVGCFAEGLFGPLREALEDRGADRRYSVVLPLLAVLEKMARAGAGSVEALADRLEELAGSLSNGGNGQFLRQHVQGLRGRGGWVSGPAEEVLVAALEELDELADWHEEGVCGEPLFQAVPPRRVPLAKWILRSCRGRFDLVILDEAHEFNHGASAQSKAAHRLTGLPGVPTLALTGSLMGGYASSLFTNFHALSPAFRREFGREDRGTFVGRYGYQKVRLTLRDSADVKPLGRYTDREMGSRRVIGEAPGVHPLFLMRYLLDTAIPVHKEDLEEALPPLVEEGVKRAALKKLFADPRFNVIDYMDVYIDDYTNLESIPPEMLATLKHARTTLFGRGEEKPEAEALPEDLKIAQAPAEAPAEAPDKKEDDGPAG
jgi:hypothetical protein